MRIAIVGATGLVGRTMTTVLAERGFSQAELIPAASSRSVGSTVPFAGRNIRAVSIADALAAKPAVALFAAGGDVSREWAPQFTSQGVWVVDNSSAWRMADGVPLVVPEVNPDALAPNRLLVANPNCSTIQLVVALAPLHRAYGIEFVHVSTYQSVSGTGMKGIEQLRAERAAMHLPTDRKAYPHPIDLNCLPQCDDFTPNLYTKEEMKLINEPRKILNLPTLRISATAVRVPVWGGHSEAVSAIFRQEVTPAEARSLLAKSPGVTVVDNPERSEYPLARLAQGKDEVFVGRIREDLAFPGHGLNLWVVADNLRKGAATNAVQIVQEIAKRFL